MRPLCLLYLFNFLDRFSFFLLLLFFLAQGEQSEVNYFTKMKGWSAFQCCLVVGPCLLCLSVWGLVWVRPDWAWLPRADGHYEFIQPNSLAAATVAAVAMCWSLWLDSSKGPLSSRRFFPRHLRTLLAMFWPRLSLGSSVQWCLWGNVLMSSSV